MAPVQIELPKEFRKLNLMDLNAIIDATNPTLSRALNQQKAIIVNHHPINPPLEQLELSMYSLAQFELPPEIIDEESSRDMNVDGGVEEGYFLGSDPGSLLAIPPPPPSRTPSPHNELTHHKSAPAFINPSRLSEGKSRKIRGKPYRRETKNNKNKKKEKEKETPKVPDPVDLVGELNALDLVDPNFLLPSQIGVISPSDVYELEDYELLCLAASDNLDDPHHEFLPDLQQCRRFGDDFRWVKGRKVLTRTYGEKIKTIQAPGLTDEENCIMTDLLVAF